VGRYSGDLAGGKAIPAIENLLPKDRDRVDQHTELDVVSKVTKLRIGTSFGSPPDEKPTDHARIPAAAIFGKRFLQKFEPGRWAARSGSCYSENVRPGDFLPVHPWKRLGSPLKTPTHKKETGP
jgi:hypothetical protein